MDTLEDQIKRVEILRDAVRLGGHDLAPNYYEYLRLAFGLANDLGEAGTPSQLAPLIPSADNGLFSRQNFYYMPANNTWENQVDLEDNGTISDDFVRLADRWEEIRRNIAFHGVHRLVLTKEQKQRFNDMMKGLMDQVVGIGDDELRASVQRTKRFERDEFIAQLPDEFRLSDIKKLAESLGVNFRTSQSWVRRMVKANLLSHDPETKIYTKKGAASLHH